MRLPLLLQLFHLSILFTLGSCKDQSKTDNFPLYLQKSATDCGPVCLKMIAEHYGTSPELAQISKLARLDSTVGVSLLGISDAAEAIGFKTLAAKIPLNKMIEEAPLPLIAHWKERHFVVVYKANHRKVWVADPARGKIEYTLAEFSDGWNIANDEEPVLGVVLLLETTKNFKSKY